MDKLWAPWRINYIKARKSKKCIFCDGLKRPPGKGFVILKTGYSFAMLNIFPYNNGHTMVSPIRHVRDISRLKDEEILDLFKAVNTVTGLLDKTIRPQGYNIGINTSSSAGAGETRHLHIHIVPRWKGDINFMTTLYDTKIISQSLSELYKVLRKHVK